MWHKCGQLPVGFWVVTIVTALDVFMCSSTDTNTPCNFKAVAALWYCNSLCKYFLVCVCPSHQYWVLYIVTQQTSIIKGVLGFLHPGVHRPFLNLVLDGSEQFVQGFTCGVLGDAHTQLFTSCLTSCWKSDCSDWQFRRQTNARIINTKHYWKKWRHF